jgi:hypothetical protein
MTGNVVCTHDISSTIGAGTRMVEVAPNGELLGLISFIFFFCFYFFLLFYFVL